MSELNNGLLPAFQNERFRSFVRSIVHQIYTSCTSQSQTVQNRACRANVVFVVLDVLREKGVKTSAFRPSTLMGIVLNQLALYPFRSLLSEWTIGCWCCSCCVVLFHSTWYIILCLYTISYSIVCVFRPMMCPTSLFVYVSVKEVVYERSNEFVVHGDADVHKWPNAG